ncbi:MAG: c-type cytochrome [Bdellovibrionales bacterium]|nr:c-type cytochrome [Bdellovibrionales bacterium]
MKKSNINKSLRFFGVVFILGLIATGVGFVMFMRHGISAKDNPTMAEVFMARRMRHWAIPAKARSQKNPVENSPEILTMAREHFADHCSTCHANDGSGQTPIGQNLYPKAPDMRLPDTQNLSDGELFYIIENGIRLTGMPAWSTGKKDGEEASWTLVHFIRHFPKITKGELDEMKTFNPRSMKEMHEEEEARQFLEGPPDQKKQHKKGK